MITNMGNTSIVKLPLQLTKNATHGHVQAILGNTTSPLRNMDHPIQSKIE